MLHGIFDSHAHYDDRRYDADRTEVFRQIRENGVCHLINVGCDMESSQNSISFAEQYDFFHAAVGIHPEYAEEATAENLTRIEAMLLHEKVAALGEIGLDYHWDEPPRDIQREAFERQLKLAVRLDIPVIIHSRDATEDTMRLLAQYRPKGVMHCFSGSAETAKEVVKLGMYVGFTGVVTFKNARRALEAAAVVPIDRLLLETDCPYMAPVPFRGKRTTSDMIAYSAEVLARVKGISAQELIDRTRENAMRLFNISL